MIRISSLFVASSLAILPISAFAQQTDAPAKTADSGITTAAPKTTPPVSSKTATPPVTGKTATPPVTGKTATMTQPAKPGAKTEASGVKTELHGMNAVTNPNRSKANSPAKSAEPTKS